MGLGMERLGARRLLQLRERRAQTASVITPVQQAPDGFIVTDHGSESTPVFGAITHRVRRTTSNGQYTSHKPNQS